MAQKSTSSALRIDCLSGISGDMLVAAFHDLLSNTGSDGSVLVDVITAIKKTVPSIRRLDAAFTRVIKNGFPATQMRLDIDEDVGHGQTDVEAINRNLVACMDAAGFKDEGARTFADAVLDIIVDAETRAHGMTGDHSHGGEHAHTHVHLHELASADTLIDILCVTRALEQIGFFSAGKGVQVFCGPVSTGRGGIKTAHGTLPVPAPGTAEILKAHGIPHVDGPVDGAELATPTGCAILAAMRPSFAGMNVPGRVVAAGTGAGTKTFPGVPNVLRLQLIDLTGGTEHHNDRVITDYVQRSPLHVRAGKVVQITLVIDDMTPEDVGHLIEKSYARGAYEAYSIPAQMKKMRPGIQVIVLCSPEAAEGLLATWMEESTTLGCRVDTVDRVVVDREQTSFHVQLRSGTKTFSGDVVAKVISWRPGAANVGVATRPRFKVEHDDLKRVAEALGTSIHGARLLVEREVRARLEPSRDELGD